MNAPTIDDLSDAEAVDLLRLLARKWIEQPSVDAFVVYRRVESHIDQHDLHVPEWVYLDSDKASPELATASRTALQCIIDGDDDVSIQWISDELGRRGEIRAQVVDPVSLAILGGTLIGCILAARVKKIGNITFYEGIPKELSKVLKEASGAISGKF